MCMWKGGWGGHTSARARAHRKRARTHTHTHTHTHTPGQSRSWLPTATIQGTLPPRLTKRSTKFDHFDQRSNKAISIILAKGHAGIAGNLKGLQGFVRIAYVELYVAVYNYIMRVPLRAGFACRRRRAPQNPCNPCSTCKIPATAANSQVRMYRTRVCVCVCVP